LQINTLKVTFHKKFYTMINLQILSDYTIALHSDMVNYFNGCKTLSEAKRDMFALWTSHMLI